ncbi:cell surface protein SprA [candidate division KSB1 bacterium]|nr:cell surface protein SprA [candidate division KSB1 bacterium]
MRLPQASPGWAHELDPRVFPFEQTPNRGLSLRGEVFPSMDWRPFSLKRRVEIDSTGNFFAVSEELNGLPLRPAYVVPVKNIVSQRLAYEQALAWHKAAAENIYRADGDERRGTGGVSIDIPVPIKSRAFEQIFGGNTVGLNVQGDISIKGGFRNENRSEVKTAYTRGSDFSFKMQQTQRFTVTGRIGEKVTVNVDQDSERAFDFENNIRLNYTGFDDDIVQKIEAGNVALSLPGTRFVTYGGNSAGLFGIKSEMQLGNLAITAIASQEKGENKRLSLSGGATEGSLRIQDYEYRRFTYFFLDTLYRAQYRYYARKWVHTYDVPQVFNGQRGTGIYDIEVYRSRGGDDRDPNAIPGAAYRDPNPARPDSTEFDSGYFIRLLPGTDYYVENTLGYIQMTNPLGPEEVLAVAYQDSGNFYGRPPRIVGDIDYQPSGDPQNPKSIRLKLIKPRGQAVPPSNPNDRNHTWNLEWKNVYYLGSRNIPAEDFQLKIFYKPPAGEPQQTFTDNGTARSFLTVFGLDERDNSGALRPDDQIDNDPLIVDRARGELIFPDLEPFEPDGTIVGGTPQPSRLPKELYVSTMYRSSVQTDIYRDSKFYIEVKSKNRSTSYSLGFNVIEGSEEVLLDGRKLTRDVDYNIDYFSGNLVILNEEATKPGHNLEISYQGNQLFQLEKKTIIGTRAEYRINPNSFIGGTLMYLNATTLDQRVRLGSVDKGPMRNLIWDFNTALRFQPNFLTSALNALPFISTQEPSDLRFEGEIAQIIPNPNTIDSKLSKENRIPGDKDGIAYIDDFEATKRTTALGVNRRGWVESSIPISILKDQSNPIAPDSLGFREERRALARRGKLLWYNPFRGVATLDIYEGRTPDQIDAGNATTQVLTMVFDPTKTVENTGLESSKSWGGIMRALSPGFFDQNESKFIEIWFEGTTGRLHIDLGRISEDTIPNGKLNTEDTKGGVRNYVLDDGEDVGLDGVKGDDRAANFALDGSGRDFWDLNGNGQRDWGEPPSDDDWFYRFENEDDKYATAEGTVNGTENSKNDGNETGGSIRPDSEDINGNGDVDRDNDYFSYSFPLDPDSAAAKKYLQGGDLRDWKLYRIPLADFDTTFGNPTLSRIEYVRLWVDGFKDAKKDSITIAEINLAGNEWKEVGIGKADGRADTTSYKKNNRLEVTVINTDENTDYRPPEGVAGEFDQIRRIRVKEQSQVVRVTGLRGGEIAVAQKNFFQPLNLLNYNRVKMFVYGNGVSLTDSVQFFIRFGADTSNYYEFRERVFFGWDPQNIMDISLIAMASLKLDSLKLSRVPGTGITNYLGLSLQGDPELRQAIGLKPNQEMRLRGNPSLTNVRTLIVGIKNFATLETQTFTGEIWMDELRVTNVKKDKGIAMRARFDLKLADFINLGGEINQRDADFHNVADRFGRGENERSYSLNGNMALDKILPQGLGLTLPVSMTYGHSLRTPKYVPGTDIQAINNDRIRKTFVDDTIRAVSNQMSVNLSVRRRARAQNFFIKNTIDNLSASLSYTQSRTTSSTIALSKRIGWSGDASYNLTFGSKNFIQPFKWIGDAPLLNKLTNTKLYYTPQSFSAQLQASNIKDSSQTQILDPRTYRISKGVLSRVSTYTATHGYRTSMKVVENISVDFSRSFTSDLLNRLRVYNQRRNRDTLNAASNLDRPQTGLMSLLTGDNEVVSMNQSFGVRYTPNLFNWFNPNVNYSANYNFTNNIQQGNIGRRAGTNTSLTANGTLRFSELFKIFKRKEPTPGREAPGRTRQAPRIPPGEQQRPERPREEGEEDRDPEQTPQDKKDEKEKQEKEDKSSRGISPLEILRFFGKFKDLSINYTRSESFAHSALDSGKTPNLEYQLGFVPRPGVGTVSGITTTPRVYQRGDNFSLSSGLDLGRNFNITLRFEHDQRRNESTTRTGSVSDSWMRFGKASGQADQGGLPFPEWTINVSGLERLNPFNKFASSLSLSHGFGGKRTQTWRDNSSNITDEDFSLNFRPLIKINLSWKNGMVSTFQYNKTSGDRPTYIFSSEENALIEQGAQITRNTDISLTTTYSKQSGFRLPLPFLKNKELRNSVDLSITFLRSVSETAQRRSGIGGEVGGQKTTRWSFSPRMTYSFSNRVRGGAHFEIGQTNSLLSGKTNIRELGIDVNISIRGE